MKYPQQSVSPDVFLKACPSRQLLARIGEKWSLMIIAALEQQPMRFGSLKTRLEGVSQKMLSQTLRHLERDGLVSRKAFNVVPLHVEYSLTATGHSLLQVAVPLKSWVETNLTTVASNNLTFDLRKHGSFD